MKKIYLFGIAIFICTQLNAQFGYDLTVLQKNYQHMTTGTIVSSGFATDDSLVVVPIGFNFTMTGTTGASLNLRFNERGFYFDTESASAAKVSGFFVMEPDIYHHGDTAGDVIHTPRIIYETTGQAGNRVFTVELLNMTFFRENYLYGTWDDSFSVTIILKELNQSVEMHFGPSNISHAADYFATQNGPFAGMLVNYDAVLDTLTAFYYLSGNAGGPVIDSISTFDTLYPALGSMPSAGTSFYFAPVAAEANNLAEMDGIKLVNTVCNNFLLVDNRQKKPVSYHFVPLNGTMVNIKGSLPYGRNSIDVGALSRGIYLIHFHAGEEEHTFRFVKI